MGKTKQEAEPEVPVIEMEGQVTVYSISGCPHCRNAKKLLKSLGVPYVEINVDKYPARRKEMVDLTGRKTVPQIFFNDKHVGGNAELQELNEIGALSEMITLVQVTPIGEGVPSVPDDEDSVLEADEMMFEFTCEPDPFLSVIEKMRAPNSGLEVKNRMYRMRNYPSCFKGSDMVDWLLVNHESIRSREHALAFGNRMLKAHHFHHVVHDHELKDGHFFYRFITEEKTRALNMQDGVSKCDPMLANDLAELIRKTILEVYDECLDEDGNAVDYKRIPSTEKWKRYLQYVNELVRLDLSNLNRQARIAFFVNIYNALVIHATVEVGQPSGVLQRLKFFTKNCYTIGGQSYSLNEIENGILRGNAKAPFSLRPPFGKNDPRRAFVLDPPEPRIHFALVCGAKSCPAIKTYSAENCEEALSDAAEVFLNDEGNLSIDEEKQVVKLSKILKWYQKDFGASERMMLFRLTEMAGEPVRRKLLGVLEKGSVKVNYFPYDWSLNSK